MIEEREAGAGFTEALQAIKRGEAKAQSLWCILETKDERDGFAIRPSPWEGPGEYQCVEYQDGRSVFVRLKDGYNLPRQTRPWRVQILRKSKARRSDSIFITNGDERCGYYPTADAAKLECDLRNRSS